MYGDQFEEFDNGYWGLIQGLKGQLYLRPPSQNPVFLNSHTNSVFLHFRKRPALVTDTFFSRVSVISVKRLFWKKKKWLEL